MHKKKKAPKFSRTSPAQTAQIQELEDRVLMSSTLPTMHPTFDAMKSRVASIPGDSSSPPTSAISPAQMRGYYGIDTIQFNTLPGDGRGLTIAIVDAFDQPNLQADFNAFNAAYHLPTSTITKYGETGSTTTLAPTAATGNWGIETNLDVEWAHVIAPLANVIVVESNSANGSDLFTAAQTAAGLPNVAVVSMSFGGPEFGGESSWDSDFTTPHGHSPVSFVASTGDTGSPGSYPAYSPNVVAVGGTSFTLDTSHAITGEVAWSLSSGKGTGGGTSLYEGEPSWQMGVQSTGKRTTPDVSMDADPATGVAIYDSFDFGTSNPWAVYGGTSLAAPMFAGVIAIADQGHVISASSTLDGPSQTLPMLYGLSASNFHDITSGNNGGFTAGTGYDEVTGRGSPVGGLMPNSLANILPTVPFYNDSATGDTITFTQDANQLYIDWSGSTSSGQFAITNPAGFRLSGTGSSTIQFNYTHGNPVPSFLSLNGTFTVQGLQGTNPLAGTTFDVNKSTLFFPYTTPANDPLTLLRGYLQSGFNGNTWTGSGTSTSGAIRSSSAAASPSTLSVGYADSADPGNPANIPTANTVEVRFAALGDTNLDNTVGIQDYNAVVRNFGTGTQWDQGAVTYGATVSINDYNAIVRNFGAVVTSPAVTAAVTAPVQSTASSTDLASASLTPTPSLSPTVVMTTNSAETTNKRSLKKGHLTMLR